MFTQTKEHRKQIRSLENELERLRSGDVLSKCEVSPRDVEWRPADVVGEGSFSTVYKGTYCGTEVAIKELKFKLSQDDKNYFRSEAALLQQLHHPRVVLLMGVCTAASRPFMLLEYLAGGTLYALIHNNEAEDLDHAAYFGVAKDVAQGMTFLHRHQPQVLHLDLKSMNVLLDSYTRAKIADFGFSILRRTRNGSPTKRGAIRGTPAWMSPELLTKGEVSSKCDVYSYAIILWEMLTSSHPFKGYDIYQIMEAVEGGQRPALPSATVSRELRELIVSCWAQNPSLRPSFEEILGALDTAAVPTSWRGILQKANVAPSLLSDITAGRTIIDVVERSAELLNRRSPGDGRRDRASELAGTRANQSSSVVPGSRRENGGSSAGRRMDSPVKRSSRSRVESPRRQPPSPQRRIQRSSLRSSRGRRGRSPKRSSTHSPPRNGSTSLYKGSPRRRPSPDKRRRSSSRTTRSEIARRSSVCRDPRRDPSRDSYPQTRRPVVKEDRPSRQGSRADSRRREEVSERRRDTSISAVRRHSQTRREDYHSPAKASSRPRGEAGRNPDDMVRVSPSYRSSKERRGAPRDRRAVSPHKDPKPDRSSRRFLHPERRSRSFSRSFNRRTRRFKTPDHRSDSRERRSHSAQTRDVRRDLSHGISDEDQDKWRLERRKRIVDSRDSLGDSQNESWTSVDEDQGTEDPRLYFDGDMDDRRHKSSREETKHGSDRSPRYPQQHRSSPSPKRRASQLRCSLDPPRVSPTNIQRRRSDVTSRGAVRPQSPPRHGHGPLLLTSEQLLNQKQRLRPVRPMELSDLSDMPEHSLNDISMILKKAMHKRRDVLDEAVSYRETINSEDLEWSDWH